jgi:hypothetical protein
MAENVMEGRKYKSAPPIELWFFASLSDFFLCPVEKLTSRGEDAWQAVAATMHVYVGYYSLRA